MESGLPSVAAPTATLDVEQWAREHAPRLLRFATLLTGRRELAEDLTQDALLVAYQRWDAIGAMEHPWAYVVRTLVHRHLAARRSAGRETRRLRLAAAPESVDPGHAVEDRSELQAAPAGLGGTGNLVCLGGIAQPSWVVGPATGTTRRGAVEALSARMNTDRPVASIGRAPVGYVGSATQTWTIDVTGATSGTVATVVSVRPLGPDRYEAAPDRICDRGTAGSRAAPADTPDVVDTDGTTLGGPPQLWCPAMAKLDTGAEGRGMTPRVAVLDLARRTSPGTPVEVGRAPMGPVETASQAWTLAHGRTKVTVAQVTPEETASSRFVARPDFTCGR